MLRRQATRTNFAAPIKAAPAPKLTTHLRASIMFNLFSIANASARRPPALPPFSLPFPAINLAMVLLPLIILVCLHVCLLLPACTDTSAPPPSSSFWSCFAPATATCYGMIDYTRRKFAVLDSGASVDITSERRCTGQPTHSPEMVQGISGNTLM